MPDKMPDKSIKVLPQNGITVCINSSRRAKRISVVVKPGGLVVATKPSGASGAAVLKFLSSKQKWIAGAVKRMSKKKVISAPGPISFSRFKIAAKELVEQKVALINETYGFKLGYIRIKNQASRWGSCSSKGNLNFNYRIALLPDNLAEYVVAHELCHLKELNHSRAFWNLVALTVPNHRACRKELRNIAFA
jgi:predicted metal-dependent hydrolase